MARKKKDRFGLSGEVHFQMAPLIDCVFLILIFFICVTNFDKVEREDLRLAYADTADEYTKDKGTLVVQVRPDGTIVAGGKPMRHQPKEELQNYFQNLVDRLGTTNYRVAIRADKRARWKEIKDIYRAAASVGLTRVTLVTETRQRPGEGGAGTSEEHLLGLGTGEDEDDETLDGAESDLPEEE
ncbi:MAG: biopolymer transporter ExbD [Verrucomicrobia bacterium]|nr:biopolymer transporter ExbD [Verrucomicrobiota bacterium]